MMFDSIHKNTGKCKLTYSESSGYTGLDAVKDVREEPLRRNWKTFCSIHYLGCGEDFKAKYIC